MKCDYGEEFVPRRATIGSAGYDFVSPDEYELKPNEWTFIDTGVRLCDEGIRRVDYSIGDPVGTTMMPVGVGHWFMAIVPRSGLSFNYGLRIINTVAIIDMDYRDTIKLKITVEEPYSLAKGERFAQGLIIPFGIFRDEIKPETTRNGGFGSTGRV